MAVVKVSEPDPGNLVGSGSIYFRGFSSEKIWSDPVLFKVGQSESGSPTLVVGRGLSINNYVIINLPCPNGCMYDRHR